MRQRNVCIQATQLSRDSNSKYEYHKSDTVWIDIMGCCGGIKDRGIIQSSWEKDEEASRERSDYVTRQWKWTSTEKVQVQKWEAIVKVVKEEEA